MEKGLVSLCSYYSVVVLFHFCLSDFCNFLYQITELGQIYMA